MTSRHNLFAALIALFLLASCAYQSEKSVEMPRFSDDELHTGCQNLAAASDLTLVDGWYYGQEARVFKSPYGFATAQQKADFAMAYHQLILDSKQNMTADWKSYYPYTQRAQFARKWWTEHSSTFVKQDPKYKVVWIHEALLDGGELWWRAYEKLAGDRVPAPVVLAHDAEQKLVFNYAEDEQHGGSFSTQERLP